MHRTSLVPTAPQRAASRALWLRAALWSCVAWWFAVAATSSPVLAQSAMPAGEAGLDVTLGGSPVVERGAPLRLYGVAYEAPGLATLTPREGLELVAELTTYTSAGNERVVATASTQSGPEGRFALTVPTPEERLGRTWIVLRVRRPGQTGRTFNFQVSITEGRVLDVLADRERYEPGETVHVLARASWGPTRAPLADVPLTLSLLDGSQRPVASAELQTRASGTVSTDFVLARSAAPGAYGLEVRTRDGELLARRPLEVFRRTTERLLASLTLDQETLLPGAPLTGQLRVTTPSGTPVRGARISVTLGAGQAAPLELVSDAEGLARLELRAPAFLSGDVETQTVFARVVHTAYGTITASAAYTLARTRWQVTARAENGALVPEIESTVFLSIEDARGRPLGVNEEVELRGIGTIAGQRVARTDAHGLVELRVRLPRGAASAVDQGRCAGTVSTSFEVEVRTRPVTTARVCVPVVLDAELTLRAVRPVAELGAAIEVEVARRPVAQGRPVLLELLSGERVHAFGWIAASSSRGEIAVPADVAGGLWTVRARPLRAADARGSLEGASVGAVGAGASIAVLLRPRDAFALDVSPAQPSYHVRERAEVTLRASSAPPAGQAWAALVVRDEAMHGGEADWSRDYLAGELRAALERPYEAAQERFLRATLAQSVVPDRPTRPMPPIVIPAWDLARWRATSEQISSNGFLRDPLYQRELLYRRQLGTAMMQLEQLVNSLGSDPARRARMLHVQGRRIEFAPDALEQSRAASHREYRTLGGELMTATMLTQADPSFSFDAVARRVARQRLVHLLMALSGLLDPDDSAAQRASANAPPERWLSLLVQLGIVSNEQLLDPWGRPFVLQRVSGRRPIVVLSERAIDWELSSPGPDGVAGNTDDVRDPFRRAIPRGTIYATASGEDTLMEALSRLAPGETVVAAMARAYGRLGLAAQEERTASVVTATSSDMEYAYEEDAAQGVADMAMSGEMEGGRGGGGRARMATGAVAASAPPPMPEASPVGRAQDERAEPSMDRDGDGIGDREDILDEPASFLGRASALVREEFPATLHFVGEVALDAQGRADVSVPLLDALTTYRLEAIAWTSSGWITSGRGTLRVDQDAMIDAPVPPVAAIGDAISLPVRVQNRTGAMLAVRVELALEGDAIAELGEATTLRIEANDAAEAIVQLRARRAGSAALVLRALAADGTPLDAVRRPLDVVEDARLVRLRRHELVEGGDALSFVVPEGALGRGPGEVRLSVAGAMFGDPNEWSERGRGDDASWAAWVLALSGAPISTELFGAIEPLLNNDGSYGDAIFFITGRDPGRVARALGALWSDPRVSDEQVRSALRFLSGAELQVPEQMGYRPGQFPQMREPTAVLLGLAPAVRSEARPALSSVLREAVERLSTAVANEGARTTDASTSVRVAAALALSGGAQEVARAREMLRRAEREVVVVGDQAWLETAQNDGSIEPRLVPTSLLALTYVGLGESRSALPHLRTLAQVARGAPHWPTEGRALASAAASRLTRGALRSGAEVRVTFDGAPIESRIEGGVVLATLPAITRGGEHLVGFALDAGVLALGQLDVRYGVAWDRPVRRQAPIELAWDGETGARETRSALRLTVRNRGARVLVRPVVEVQLPAGAELDEASREALTARLAAPPAIEGSTLRLELRSLAPGGYVRLPIPLRWSLGGTLRGLGATVWDDAQPASGEEVAAAVLVSREVAIADRGEQAPAAEHESSAPPRPPIPEPRPIQPFDPIPSLAEGIR